MLRFKILLFLFLPAICFAAPDITITPYVGNPVLSPGTSGTQDDFSTNNPFIVKTGSTWAIVYAGDAGIGWSWAGFNAGTTKVMFATASSYPGAVTRSGITLDGPGAGYTPSTLGPSLLFDSSTSTWHMWVDTIPDIACNYTTGYCRWYIGHLTHSGTADSLPTSGWTWENPQAIDFATNNFFPWTSVVVPKSGGGWVMYLGTYNSDTYVRGLYCATATSLNGPWTVDFANPIDSSTPGLEFAAYFSYAGKYYLFSNTATVPPVTRLYEASVQTGPWSISIDPVPNGFYITGLDGTDLNSGTLQGIHQTGASPFYSYQGAFTLTAPPAVTPGTHGAFTLRNGRMP